MRASLFIGGGLLNTRFPHGNQAIRTTDRDETPSTGPKLDSGFGVCLNSLRLAVFSLQRTAGEVSRVSCEAPLQKEVRMRFLVIVHPYDPVLGYAARSSGAGIPLRCAVIASTRNSSALRFWSQHVRVTVNKRPDTIAPASVLFPNQILRHRPATRMPLSEELFVGSTPS